MLRIFSWKSCLLQWLCALQVICIICNPYHVPLQGVVGGKRTLVLFDNLEMVPNYSRFFAELRARGHSLSFLQAESPDVKLKSYGESVFDNIIFFCPAADRFSSISLDDILDFSEGGGNIMIAGSTDTSENLRDITEQFGVKFDKKGTKVLDHFEFHPSTDRSLQHSFIMAKNSVQSKAVLGEYSGSGASKPVLYHGIGHSINPQNILAFTVLAGNPSTYSASTSTSVDSGLESSGQETLLVSAIQGRNNARVIISGSIDMFSNAFYGKDMDVGNSLFCAELTKWGFGEMAVLRFRDITHTRSDGVPPDVILHEKQRPDLPLSLYPDPEITRNSLVYRIKDEIVYSMIVEEFRGGEWHPFSADDMQMEFVMLDPYIRKTMTSDPSTGRFIAKFISPDSYGIFKFRVLYRRLGYSVLQAETQVSIRPFKHDEYERFIFSAYPYYSSAISAAVAFFVFAIFFLFSTDSK